MIPRIPNAYAPHEYMVAPARQSAEIWRLCLGCALCVLITLGLTTAIVELAGQILPPDTFAALAEGLGQAATPAGMLFLLFLMAPLGVGAIAVVEIVHKRSFLTLFGPIPVAIRQFVVVAMAVGALYIAVIILPPWGFTSRTLPGLGFGTWLALLPLTLVALLVQVGSEEILFRGYLQQQLAARTRHPLVWMGLPSVLFALGHHLPELYGPNVWLITGWALVFGLAAADLTARSGTLGPALALHLLNNIMALAVTSMQGEMSGLALFQMPFGPADHDMLRAWLPVDLAMIGLGWLAARLALRV